MAFAITQACCADASCVSVCPVNCISPTPEERAFGSTEMLHIDPKVCIDCGACADACPVDAIKPVDLLRGPEEVYAEINAAWFAEGNANPEWGSPVFPPSLPNGSSPLRVAVVGTGPSAGYAVQSLLSTSCKITMVDRLAHAGGLLRYGVAPDHLDTRRMGDRFAAFQDHPRVRMRLGTEVGVDVSHADLLAEHDAVIYAVGAASDRALNIPGEELAGSMAARTFVAWYNGHPDVPDAAIDLSAERAVVIGNGNVALDVARILLADPDTLAGSAIAPEALAALRRSRVREVVLVGRRGPEHASYSRSELHALRETPGLDVVVDGDAELAAAIGAAGPRDKGSWLQGVPVEPIAWSAPPPFGRRLVLRFHATPVEVVGDAAAAAVRLQETTGAGAEVEIPAGLVLRSIGYRGVPVPGLPFDEATGTIPHQAGRVVDPATGQPLPGTYVTGWIKRGPVGGIGTNRGCAAETVGSLFEDAAAGRLPVRRRLPLVRRIVRDVVGA